MWLRRSRTLSSRRADAEAESISTPRAPSRLQASFSFKDVQSLFDDPNPNPNPNPISRKPSIFHRVRIASSALWTRRSASSTSPATDKRIVLYSTSLRVVRKTFEDCRAVVSILRSFRVVVDERDLSMDSAFLDELRGVLGKKHLALPVVFIGGRYIGGAEEVLQLHESGELKKFVEGAPAAEAGTCQRCGGVRFVLCGRCSGSRKYYHSEKAAFRTCSACNENGLVRCPDCSSAS